VANIIVVGTQWGDEGKGKIVDLLASEADIVARYQGGANAGHTVVRDGEEFVFHLIPSGILHKGKICLLGNGVVIDPEALWKEVVQLKKRGIEVEGRLFISENAHLTLPYHRLLDQAKEERRGSTPLGTTHRGIGPTYTDKMGRVGIRVVDLLNPILFAEKVRRNSEEKLFLLKHFYGKKGFDIERLIKEYRIYGKRFKNYIADTTTLINEAIDRGKSILFEGAQGTLLDIDFGTYPFVTASNPIAGGACSGLGVGPTKIDRVIGVAKAYTTRIGAGPFPTEFSPEMNEWVRVKGREYGATTGRPRRCGWFDSIVVRHAVRVNGIDSLTITKLDVLDDFSTLKVCTGYKIKGRVITSFPSQTQLLPFCEPIYEEMEGWRGSTRRARKLKDLPRKAREYLNLISELVGAKISIISVGPRREETIFV